MTEEPIRIDDLRDRIDAQYVGLRPNTSSVKPVHLANALFRRLTGVSFDTQQLNQFVFTQKHTGETPRGHELESVRNSLVAKGRMEEDAITDNEFMEFRRLLKKVVNVDSGVFMYKDRMESYTAGHAAFVTDDRIAQDAGEMVAEWLLSSHSPLASCVQTTLSMKNDPIYTLCSPLLDEQGRPPKEVRDLSSFKLFKGEVLPDGQRIWRGLSDAAATLSRHLENHPDKLFRLRMATLFASVVTFRHLAALESSYVPTKGSRVIPILLDFSSDSKDPVARASSMTYSLVCQSVTRFYSWAFGQELSDKYSLSELGSRQVTFKRKTPSTEMIETWALTSEEAVHASEPFEVYGRACYDVMALEQEGDPIRYLRMLATRSGLAWPPENFVTAKRFALHQDLLEVLIRACINPGETVGLPELQGRLWDRFGMVVGGRGEDEEILLQSGVYHADSLSLRKNKLAFAERLSKELSFARLLADGVMQVEMEGQHHAD